MVQSKRVTVGYTNSGSHTSSTYKPRMAMYESQTEGTAVPARESKTRNLLKTRETSTWKVEHYAPPEYTTEKREKFVNPKTRASSADLLPPQDHEAQRRGMREKAVKKFEALAMKRYGSMEKLFKAVYMSYHLTRRCLIMICIYMGNSSKRIPMIS